MNLKYDAELENYLDELVATGVFDEGYKSLLDEPPFAQQKSKAQERKDTPVFSGVLAYFPDAIKAVSRASKAGNDQHNPNSPLHWDRSKSGDELDALTRHLLEAGTIDDDGIRHSTKVCWRALANLQKEIENSLK